MQISRFATVHDVVRDYAELDYALDKYTIKSQRPFDYYTVFPNSQNLRDAIVMQSWNS